MKKVIKRCLKDKKGAILLEVLTSIAIISVVILTFTNFSVVSINNYNNSLKTSKAVQSVFKKAISGNSEKTQDINNGLKMNFYIDDVVDSQGNQVSIPINIGDLSMELYEVKGHNNDLNYDYVLGYSDKIKAYKMIQTP